MEKAIWNGKEIVAFDIAEKYEFEKAIRKASGRKELLCPDEYCTHRVLRYCHGEKKGAYFAHLNNSDCAYEKYDNATSETTKNIKRLLYSYFKSKNYDVQMDVKLIQGHYTHLVLHSDDKQYAVQIISKFSSANRIDDFFIKYKGASIPVIWIVTDSGENNVINESEMNFAKRFSINETSDNSIITIDLKGESITLYKMDTKEYLYNGRPLYSSNYPKIFTRQYPISKLEFVNGMLTVPEFKDEFENFLAKKAVAFEKLKQERADEEKRQIEAAEKRRKEIEEWNKKVEAEELEKRRKLEERLRTERENREKVALEEKRKKEEEKSKQREELKELSQGYEIGDRVEHIRFGNGTVTDVIGNSITINFDKKGIKRLAINAQKESMRKTT